MSQTNPFEVALTEARKSLEESYQERSAIEKRIVKLKQTIDGLAALCEPEPNEDLVEVQGAHLPDGYNTSLTDAIRKIFSETTQPMLMPVEVRDALLAMGVNLAKYKQPLVPIHNTLKRLEAQGELVPFRDDAGDLRGYRWVSPLARAVAEVDSNRPAHELKMWSVNPGASNRLEQLLRLREAPIKPDKSPTVVPMAELEKQAILNALAQVNGDKMLAARLLGIGKVTLYRKLKEFESQNRAAGPRADDIGR